MRFHWYWPFARREEIDWAIGTTRPEDSILVEVIDRPEAPAAGVHGGVVTVVRDLPDVERDSHRGVRWLASRARTYSRRSLIRRTHWRNEDFDLVHLHYLNRFTDSFVELPHPLVMSVHDVVPHESRLGSYGERRLLHRLYSRADAMVVHHRRLADRLLADFGVPASHVHIVPHQVFPVGAVPLRPDDGPPVVLFFGALRRNKGLEVLADALRELHSDELRVVVAGRGEARLEELARQMAANDRRVTVEIGQVSLERKRELFCGASVVVLPYTEFASQSGVLHDAYGHGRPLVVSDVGALGDTVGDDGTGLVVPARDPKRLASAIEELLREDTWSLAASRARRISKERSPEAVGSLLRRVYDEVLP